MIYETWLSCTASVEFRNENQQVAPIRRNLPITTASDAKLPVIRSSENVSFPLELPFSVHHIGKVEKVLNCHSWQKYMNGVPGF